MRHRRLEGRVGRAIATMLLVAGCGDQARPAAPASTSPPTTTATVTQTTDELLALAPAGTQRAVVMSARGLELVQGALAWIDAASGNATPQAAAAMATLDAQGGAQLGLAHLDQLRTLGLGGGRGLARFTLADDATLSIWPVIDRARFVATLGGRRGDAGLDEVILDGAPARCGERRGVYACAADPALLDRLGTGSLAGAPARTGARGDLELVATGAGSDDPHAAWATTIALAPGELTARVHIGGAPVPAMAALAGEAITLDPRGAAGFVAATLTPPAHAWLAAEAPELAALVSDAFGRVTVRVDAGSDDVAVRVPLARATHAAAALRACTSASATVAFARAGDACAITFAAGRPVTTFARLDGNVLVLTSAATASTPTPAPAPSPLARDLAGGGWQLVAWGRGAGLLIPAAVAGIRLGGVDAAAWSRSLTFFDEVGLGLRVEPDGVTLLVGARTFVANPPAIVDELRALMPAAQAGVDVRREVAELAMRDPSSPLAMDQLVGPHGLMLPAALLYLYATVVLPSTLPASP